MAYFLFENSAVTYFLSHLFPVHIFILGQISPLSS